MKKIILLVILLFSLNSFSQIYFGTNTAMYVKNELLYVKQDINLQSNSILYLRNRSQLVQGTTSTSLNSGTGIVSVYQEGTSDNFDYNYWCSPIGSTAATGNGNFGITMLNRPLSATTAEVAIVLPLATKDGISNPLSIAARWIYKLINANSYSQWIYIGGASTIASGEGFTMKGTGGTDNLDAESNGVQNNPGGIGAQRYDFRGRPNDGNITVSLGLNNATLSGNPYPSALHLNAFLLDTDNTAGTGIAYFWEQNKAVNSHFIADYRAGYGSYSPISLGSNGVYVPATFNSYNDDGSLNTTGTSSGLVIARKYSPIGQGFILNGRITGTVTLKNSHRAYYKEGNPLTQFERPAKNKASKISESIPNTSYFKLNAILNNQFTRQLALAFLPEATDGVDYGIDALNMDASLPNDVSFLLEDKNYVIQGVNFEETKKIPLAVKATNNTTIKFYVPEVINFDLSQSIYIHDALDDSYHDIKNNVYEVAVPKGTYSDRFKITFIDEKKLNTKDLTKPTFTINQNNTDQKLMISNTTQVDIKSVIVYDMLGRIILSKEILGNNQHYYFSTSGLSSGIYIVELLTVDTLKTTQKVIISNSGK
ncbi:T9SS type A sorting domain-containing protein [Flavobacterium sp. PL02]|uniref:T9SS type A sorting domain-containing protein n=1 Tax=Flavobacterium sp. PL02 TaxID=3088354 RepID=UPI002B2340C0|nr:T9SS type A sorting domain-containing protein [Flavobacterium sp. PL02]MEA9415827.1 T9SS type A sorting domain-containing protein [Flavobacterium sp. PL02]